MMLKLSIKTKIILLSILSVAFVAAFIIGIIVVREGSLQEDIEHELHELAESETKKVAMSTYLLLEASDKQFSTTLETVLPSAKQRLMEQADALVETNAEGNQRGITFDKNRASQVLTRLKNSFGLDFGMYQKSAAGEGLVQVAGTMETKGDEAVSLKINANGTHSTVYDEKGRIRPSRVTPLKDVSGRMVGALVAVITDTQMAAVREAIMGMAVGKTGYVFTLQGLGENRGAYLVSYQGKRDGENIWGAKDANGNLFIQSLVKKATDTRGGEIVYEEYAWKNDGDDVAREKLTAATYYEPWAWVIGAGVYEDDFFGAKQRVGESIEAMVAWSGGGALVLLFVAGVLALFISSRIANPLIRVVDAAKSLAKGDIKQDIDVTSNDEVGELEDAFSTLIDAQQQKAYVAEQIAKGDLAVNANVLSDEDTLAISMNTMKGAIKRLAEDITMLVDASVEGRLGVRADVSKHAGEYASCIGGVNQTVSTLVGHIDAMPAPAFIVGKDFSIRFVNEAAAGVLKKRPEQIIGTKCSDNFKTEHCGTGSCACKQAMATGTNISEQTVARPSGEELEIDYTGVPVKNLDGNIIGALEVLSDQTAVRRAARVADKQAAFQKTEVEKLVEGLQEVARGDLSGSIEVAATDKDTESIGKNFGTIHSGLGEIKENVGRLISDVNGLAEAAVDGDLAKRANASEHTGDYQLIISGVNETLDAVIEPINEAAKILDRLSDYDLRARMEGDYKGDHAKIKASLNATALALHDSMIQVADAADQVSEASTQIASSSQSVAEGTSEQASSLEETSSSLEEMSSMTKQNADNTQQAKALAENARSSADVGSKAMGDMVGSMTQIKSAAEGTAAIIKDINEIAFQTNLLALNAAVEAARAGDAGRGFAVVAEEVRNLAGRAKEAAKKTEGLIKESMTLAESGSELSGRVNENLSEIVSSVGKVTSIVGEITIASTEQARGIEQVNGAVSEMDKVVQQSAANAEESSSAAEELSSQAQELAAMVSRFQLNRKSVSAAKTVRKPVPQVSASAPKKKTGGNGISVIPEAIIPLDDDPDFAEF